MRSRIWARAAATAGGATASAGGAETATEDFVECADEEAIAADTTDFAACVAAERDVADKFGDEFADECADEFEWLVKDVPCVEVPSCECASGLGAGPPGKADALYLTGCVPFCDLSKERSRSAIMAWPLRAPKTKPSRRELLARRLAPWTPVSA